ncbi:Type IV pilus biogenesis and competence protein PilQ [Pandoraea pneumonica]|uniref:Type IV pilus biogenesis and competence protein PilQ n=1 Tax=Pandoraea pneumonica TaxID=2508299 RepID=A0A5E4Z9W8_9BURK|nr:type IV pilus secretin PilQ [Pandoraea pneumonica]VVE57205.1 Type IV pilus biogenesis and competence protein PilQ [Pandoraea pneumonica]
MTNERHSSADVRDLLADLVERWHRWTSVSPLEWPSSVRAALGAVAVLIGFTLAWSIWWLVGLPVRMSLKHDTETAQAALDRAVVQASRLPQLSATLQSAEAETVAWERLLPMAAGGGPEDKWRSDLESLVARGGMALETARPGETSSKSGIETERAEIQVKGAVADLIGLLAEIDRAPRHLTIERMHLQAPEMGAPVPSGVQATLKTTVTAHRWQPAAVPTVVSDSMSLPRLPEAAPPWQMPATTIDVFRASLSGRPGPPAVAMAAAGQQPLAVDPAEPIGTMRAGRRRVTFRRTANASSMDWDGPANPPEALAQTPVSVALHGVEAAVALRAFARLTGRNLVVGEHVGGALEVEMANVSPATAFDVLIRAAGLGVRSVGGVDWVAPRAELLADEQTQLEAASKRETLLPLVSRRFTLNYPRALELREIIIGEKDRKTQRLLSSRGSLIADPRTNQLFVTDLPERLEALSAFIARIDVPVRQVLIEARIVEADDRFSESLGVSLAGYYARAKGSKAATGANAHEGGATPRRGGNAAGGEPPAPANAVGRGAADVIESALPAAVLAGVAPPSLAITLFGRSATRFLQLELSALETSGRGRVVSRPRIVTADKVEAVIEQGTELPYQARSNRRNASTVQFRKATLRLEVTPLITPDGQVILDVDVRKDSVGHAVADGFAVDTRHVKTQVQVENGGTVAIGGIYQEERRNSRAQVPWLGDVPLLGTLFRNRSGEDRRTELLVFITPSVVPETGGVDAEMTPANPAPAKGSADATPIGEGFRRHSVPPEANPDVPVNDLPAGHPRLTAASLEATRSARPTHIPVSSGIGTQISAIHAGKRNTCRIDGGGQDHGRTRCRATSRTAVL